MLAVGRRQTRRLRDRRSRRRSRALMKRSLAPSLFRRSRFCCPGKQGREAAARPKPVIGNDGAVRSPGRKRNSRSFDGRAGPTEPVRVARSFRLLMAPTASSFRPVLHVLAAATFNWFHLLPDVTGPARQCVDDLQPTHCPGGDVPGLQRTGRANYAQWFFLRRLFATVFGRKWEAARLHLRSGDAPGTIKASR